MRPRFREMSVHNSAKAGIRMFKGNGRLLLMAALAFCLLFAFSARVEAFTLISTSQELEIGTQAAAELEKKFGLVDARALPARVQRIGTRNGTVSHRGPPS